MAQVAPLDMLAPGSRGLNTERSQTLLSHMWATEALNAVVNRAGRLANRKGWTDQTTNAIAGTPSIKVLHEYLPTSGEKFVITCAGNKIFKNINDYTDVANDITSTTTPTNDNWKFVNFRGKALGFQRGHLPIEWPGSGDCTDAVYLEGTGPDGNEALAAFGRVWAVGSDLQTIYISSLLDETDYTLAGGGQTIDMTSVWTNGIDEIVALAAIGANFVVFGRNHIVMWEDGSGSEIGLTPTTMHVSDTIEGTGCIARDSIQKTGEGDLIFLSRHGLQSLGRVIQFKSNPTVTLTKNVRANFLESIRQERITDPELDGVRSVFSPEEGIYIINFPIGNKQWTLDLHHPFQDDDGDQAVPVMNWEIGGNINALLNTTDGSLYFGSDGVVGLYADSTDNGASYTLDFKSGWLDFGEVNHRLKMMKEIVARVAIGSGTVSYNWEFDFSGQTLNRVHTYSSGTTALWGEAEWSIGEFSGDVNIQRVTLPAHGEGQFLRVGTTLEVNGFDIAIQQISIATKIGRMIT